MSQVGPTADLIRSRLADGWCAVVGLTSTSEAALAAAVADDSLDGFCALRKIAGQAIEAGRRELGGMVDGWIAAVHSASRAVVHANLKAIVILYAVGQDVAVRGRRRQQLGRRPG